MVQLDEDRSQFVLRMSDTQWKEYAKKVIVDNRGKGDLRPVLNWLDAMDARRAEHKSKTAAPLIVRDMDPDAVLFRVWRDMVLEPSKYGDADWEEWLQMDTQLRTGPKRWRVAAFWLQMEDEERERTRDACAIRIQACWRGHHVRATQEGLSCEDCLARGIAPKRFNDQHLCDGCWMHRIEHWGYYIQPVVPPTRSPSPLPEGDENGMVACYGCGRINCYSGDYGEYRDGYWCSRACAYH